MPELRFSYILSGDGFILISMQNAILSKNKPADTDSLADE